jgi:hypothetical protein
LEPGKKVLVIEDLISTGGSSLLAVEAVRGEGGCEVVDVLAIVSWELAQANIAFEEAGLENEEAMASVGRRFRDTVLALGGSQHPLEVFKAFRGREPDTEPLLKVVKEQLKSRL